MKKINLVVLIFISLLIGQVFCYSKDNKLPVQGSGYVGSLPDLPAYHKREQDSAEKKDSSVQAIPSKNFNSESELKPVPDDNPAFVNIILKPDKTSKYLNDIHEIIPLLEEIYDLIDENKNVQLFNAKVYYFNKCVDYFRDKYEDKPESNYISYKKLMELNIHSRSVALLRTEAKKYNPYLSYSGAGYIYDPNNLNEQLGYLKDEIRQVILVLREAN